MRALRSARPLRPHLGVVLLPLDAAAGVVLQPVQAPALLRRHHAVGLGLVLGLADMALLVLQAAGVRLGATYPAPIVDLAAGRDRALQAFAGLRKAA